MWWWEKKIKENDEQAREMFNELIPLWFHLILIDQHTLRVKASANDTIWWLSPFVNYESNYLTLGVNEIVILLAQQSSTDERHFGGLLSKNGVFITGSMA